MPISHPPQKTGAAAESMPHSGGMSAASRSFLKGTPAMKRSFVIHSFQRPADDSPSPGGDLSRLGSGERNLAEPKVAQQPSERARASQRRGEGELNSKLKTQHSTFHPARRPPEHIFFLRSRFALRSPRFHLRFRAFPLFRGSNTSVSARLRTPLHAHARLCKTLPGGRGTQSSKLMSLGTPPGKSAKSVVSNQNQTNIKPIYAKKILLAHAGSGFRRHTCGIHTGSHVKNHT